MKLHARIQNNRILPEYSSDYDQLKKLKKDETYVIEIKQPRNLRFHRKFFALLNLAFDNQDTFNNIEHLREWCIMKSGYYVRVATPEGEFFRPKSISFAKMDETEFSELYSKVLDTICNWLDISDEDLQNELVNYF